MAFCIECGMKLPQNAKFCANCGTKVGVQGEYIDVNSEHHVENKTNIDQKPKFKTKDKEKKFVIKSQEVVFREPTTQIIEIRREFYQTAYENIKDFESFYDNHIHTLDDLFGIGFEKYTSLLNNSLKLGVKTLFLYGIHDIDIACLAECEGYDSTWEEVAEDAQSIRDMAANLNSYREKQRSSRSYWEGGGFGVSGAIKGAVTAGAMNAVMGMFRGIGDAITDSSDKKKFQKMQLDYIKTSDAKFMLLCGLWSYCCDLGLTVTKILVEHGILTGYGTDYDTIDAKLNNYKTMYLDDEISEEEITDYIYRGIQEWPFFIEYYKVLFTWGWVVRDDIENLLDYLGMKEFMFSYLHIISLELIEYAKTESESTIEEIEYKIDYIEAFAEDDPAINEDEYIQKLKEKKENLQEKEEIDSLKLSIKKISAMPRETLEDLYNQYRLIEELRNKAEYTTDSFFNEYITPLKDMAFRMQVASILEKYYLQIATCSGFSLVGAINPRQLMNAKKTNFPQIDIDRVIGFYDTTIMLNGKDGYIFTDTELYFRESFYEAEKLSYNQIKSVSLLKSGKIDAKNVLLFELMNGQEIKLVNTMINKTPLCKFFAELLLYRDNPFIRFGALDKLHEGKEQKKNAEQYNMERETCTDIRVLFNKYYKDIPVYSSSFYIKGAIPSKKLCAAISKYASGVDSDSIIGLYDTTVFGSAKEGYLFTDKEIYYKDATMNRSDVIVYNDISDLIVVEKGVRDCDNILYITLMNGEKKILHSTYVNKTPLYNFLKEIIG